MLKSLPAKQETPVHSLGWEDTLEKRMAINSGILAWRIPWTEEPGGLYIITGSQRVGHDRATNIFTFLMCFDEFLIPDRQRWMKFIDLLYTHVRQGSKDITLTETEQLFMGDNITACNLAIHCIFGILCTALAEAISCIWI